MADWFCEGNRVDSLPLDDRGIYYGDGLFETIAIRHGKTRLWSLHVQRLADGCQRLGIAAPDAGKLKKSLLDALANSTVDDRYALAKIIVTAGSAERGYQRPANAQTRVLVGVFAANRLAPSCYESGVSVARCKIQIAAQAAFAGLKTLNRLEQVLARAEWSDPDVFEGLMCDTGGQLICGTMTNVFIVRNKSLLTPDLSRCGVAGVMRRQVCDVAAAAGFDVRITDIPWGDAAAADEMFLSNSQFGVLPVARFDTQDMSTAEPGSLTREIMTLLAQSGIEECAA